MSVNLEWYKVFYHAAKMRSFSKAAEELFISQPAVSQVIKQLEEELDCQLFLRIPRGVKLTREGELLFKYVEQAYNLIRTAEKKICDINNLVSGEIKIGASDTLSKYYLLPYLEEFHQSYPEVKIQVTNRTTPETIKLLRTGNVDLGIVNLPLEDDHLIIKKGITIQDCFVADKKYKKLAESEILIRDLINYPILLLEQGTNTRKFIDTYAAKHGLILTPEIELGSIDVLVQFAKIGLGISYVVKNFVKEELESNHLYEIKLKEQIPERSIGIITYKDIPLSKAAEKFISLFELEN
ncbi:MAG: LysR family transcriptional regulator [Halanaerobiales bacterium]|nr:LysR family transcriptional regulator [Halanaerobiales bacterium]